MDPDSRELFRNLVEGTSGGILVAEIATHRFIYANPAICRFLGYSADELLTLSVDDIHPHGDLPRVLNEFEAQARGEKVLASELPCRRRDGSVVYADINTAPAVIAGMPCNVGFFNDVTDRREAAEALRRSERQLREANQLLEAVLDAIPDLIGVQDVDHTILRYNDAGYRMLKTTPEQALGKKCFELIQRDRPCEECASRDAIRSGRATQVLKHFPEMGLWIDCRSYPVLDENGRVSRVVEHLRDVTERRSLEEQLRQAERLQAIGQLAGGVAHDFNNQLGGILGLAELLRAEVSDRPDLLEITDGILSSVERASNLTSQLLAFARRGKYRVEPVDVHALIGEVATLLSRSIDKRIRIEHRLSTSPCSVLGDPSQLQNVLLNLALNARDAMPQGGDLLFETSIVTLDSPYCSNHAYQIEPGAYVQIIVSDSGTGMDRATQSRMFEPFFTTKEKGKGTGMGLAAVYGSVKSHQGAIDVISEPGRGTAVKVYLPLHTAASATPPRQEHRVSPNPGGLVLLVDDEPMILTATTTMLERLGYRVIACKSGEEALRIYREKWASIDLVVLDMVMPILSGKATFASLQLINPQVRAVLSSGYSLNGEAQETLAQGAIAFLQKPFRLSDLARVLTEALSGP